MTSLIADKTRAGFMGPGHVRRLDRLESAVNDPLAFTDVEPTLDLDFTDIKGAPFAGNLTRATVGGYRMNNKGVLVPTVANEPVINFDSAGKPIGTGLYGAYTNLLLRSEEFDNASWTKTETTITANAVAAPDGLVIADKIVETATTAVHFVTSNPMTIASGAVVTASVFVKAAERTALQVRISGSGGVANVGVNLSSGALATPTGTGPFSSVSASIETLSDGWYRVNLTATTTGITTVSVLLILGAVGSDNYAGNTSNGLYAWGAQLTATAFPVPYVPTTSATVARNQDTFTLTGTDFTDFFNATEGTIYIDANVTRYPTSFPRMFQFDDTTDSNRHSLFFNPATGQLQFVTFVGGVTSAGLTSGVISAGAQSRAVYSYKANSFNAAFNGAAVSPDLSGAVPTGLARLWIGAGEMLEHVRRLIYFPKALSATELQRMTA